MDRAAVANQAATDRRQARVSLDARATAARPVGRGAGARRLADRGRRGRAPRCAAHGYSAMLALPLASSSGALGALAFGSATERSWSDELVMRLRLVAEVLANALARKQTEDALRGSETMKSSILHSLRSGVAVVDREGHVLALNANWTRLAEESGAPVVKVGDDLFGGGAGASIRGVGRRARRGRALGPAGARATASATSTRPRPPRGRAGGRSWSIRSTVLMAVPSSRAPTSPICARAEVDVQRTRQELAHVGRVSTVGELTASLAHELYQPLTAIMTNAQAARRMLAAASRTSPRSIASSRTSSTTTGARSDVIERLRDLLRKGELEMVPVDLASTIRDVADLLRGDAVVKQVQVTLDLDGYPVVVLGDRVQLQQVMLNLLHNAMEAMADGRSRATDGVSALPARGRRPVPRALRAQGRSCRQGQTRPLDGLGARPVTVRDTGPGSSPARKTPSSIPSTPRRRTAWAWDSRSCGRSSNPMAARSPRPITSWGAPCSSSRCRSAGDARTRDAALLMRPSFFRMNAAGRTRVYSARASSGSSDSVFGGVTVRTLTAASCGSSPSRSVSWSARSRLEARAAQDKPVAPNQAARPQRTEAEARALAEKHRQERAGWRKRNG